MLKDIVRFVGECDACQHSKGERKRVLPRPMSIPFGPWTHVAIDHVGPLPATPSGARYVLVMMCRLTKVVELAAVPDTSILTTVNALISHVICRHGLFLYVLSDRASGFVSELIRAVYTRLGIKYTTTTAYHPQSNGGVEVFNKVLAKLEKLWCNAQQTDWDDLLPFVRFAYLTSFHTGIQEEPFFLSEGRYARLLPSDDFSTPPVTDLHAYADGVAERIDGTTRHIRELLASVNEERTEALLEKGKLERKFEIGDKVLLYNPATPRRHARKLVKRWTGPYVVAARVNDVNYHILVNDNIKTIHVHRLRKYEDADKLNLYEHDMTCAQDELAAVQQYRDQLHQRELQLQSQHQQLQIGQAAEEKVEANESESESAVVVTSSISSSISSSSSSSSPYMLAELTAPLLKWM